MNDVSVTRAVRHLLDELVGDSKCVFYSGPDPVVWRVYKPAIPGSRPTFRMSVMLWADMQLEARVHGGDEELPATIHVFLNEPDGLLQLEELYRRHFR